MVSCPTCGRTQIDLIGLANQVENMVQDIPLDIKVAVMGCVVNGPGEAKEADIGICRRKGRGPAYQKRPDRQEGAGGSASGRFERRAFELESGTEW